VKVKFNKKTICIFLKVRSIPIKSFFEVMRIFYWLPIPLSAIRHLPAGTATTAAVAFRQKGRSSPPRLSSRSLPAPCRAASIGGRFLEQRMRNKRRKWLVITPTKSKFFFVNFCNCVRYSVCFPNCHLCRLFCWFIVVVSSFSLTDNVLQLPEGGDFEALHCQPSRNPP